jgi:hypothetical protein
MSTWRYDPGEGRKKHAWPKDEAGFEPSGKGPVGKCPQSISREFAEQLLNEGIPVFEDDDSEVPERIYNVYKGVVYEARRTEYGKSFHGFPWRGDKGISQRIPARIIIQLEARAKEDSELREFKRWMKKYGGQ